MARYEDEQSAPEDRDKVVVEKDRSGPGAVIAAVVAILILALVIWFLFGLANTADDATDNGVDVDITPGETTQPPENNAPQPAPGAETETETETETAPDTTDDQGGDTQQ